MAESKYHTLINPLPHSGQWEDTLLRRVYAQVFHTSFAAPGFALLSFQEPISSHHLRSLMLSLKNDLSALHQKAAGKHLVYLSLHRNTGSDMTAAPYSIVRQTGKKEK